MTTTSTSLPGARLRIRSRLKSWRRSGSNNPSLLVLAILCVGMADPAMGQAQAPAFSAQEQALIARNASLKAVLNFSPATVRQILDALVASRAGASRANLPAENAIRPKPGTSFEQDVDPDLSDLQRISPEAAHDIFQVLKQVASTKPAKPPH